MNDSSLPFDLQQRVPGELNFLGYESLRFDFNFAEIMAGIETLDGDESSGLHFRRGQPQYSDSGERTLLMSSETFCVGGGCNQRYICHIYGQQGELWLTSANGDPDELYEMNYDCGCDVEQGIFPGDFVVSYAELLEAALHFFRTEAPSDQFRWVRADEMHFDPWIRD